MSRIVSVFILSLCTIMLISCEKSTRESQTADQQTAAQKQQKARTNWNIPKHGVNANGLPTISLMPWLSVAKEGQWFAELRLYQTGAKEVPGLQVFYKVSGTAKNGYDYTNVNSSIKMLPHTYNNFTYSKKKRLNQ